MARVGCRALRCSCARRHDRHLVSIQNIGALRLAVFVELALQPLARFHRAAARVERNFAFGCRATAMRGDDSNKEAAVCAMHTCVQTLGRASRGARRICSPWADFKRPLADGVLGARALAI
jgi:hypothetical protein